ncbi:NAD(P)H-dependent oxidoreductase [Alkalicoccus chagannorensis]|uniref:NAD(P)H-dependent oxidoreductase n=1 Tax=Alkalicoccus chagannorensis TaxID=427072 RepID=UPI001476A22A|nr:NAD(P)H-dependent oxidoreductase [Alkalicoccus chagannorensis]
MLCMNIVAVYMHPSWDSFNGAVFQAVQEKALYQQWTTFAPAVEKMNPLLTIEEYKQSIDGRYPPELEEAQDQLREADHVLFFFPVWWGGFPAAGKGFIDRVFAYGKAHELEGEEPIPLLTGKRASLFFTTGTPPEVFEEKGFYDQTVGAIRDQLLEFCGLELHTVKHFGDVHQASDEDRQKMLQEAAEAAARLSE